MIGPALLLFGAWGIGFVVGYFVGYTSGFSTGQIDMLDEINRQYGDQLDVSLPDQFLRDK